MSTILYIKKSRLRLTKRKISKISKMCGKSSRSTPNSLGQKNVGAAPGREQVIVAAAEAPTDGSSH